MINLIPSLALRFLFALFHATFTLTMDIQFLLYYNPLLIWFHPLVVTSIQNPVEPHNLAHFSFPNKRYPDSTICGFDYTISTDPISALGGTTTITILLNSSIQISFSVSQISSNRLTGLNYFFKLIGNEKSENITLVTDYLNPSVTFSDNVKFAPDICYTITVSVANCANEGAVVTASPTYFRLQGIELYEFIYCINYLCAH